MCDISSDIREEDDDIKLEKYGTVIAAPKVNVYLMCCTRCHDMFKQMEEFIEHIKQEHVKNNTNNPLSVPTEATTIKQEEGSTTAHQITVSNITTLPQWEDKNATNIATSCLQHNDFPQTNIEKPLADQERAFNWQNNIAIKEEVVEKETWLEKITVKEPAEQKQLSSKDLSVPTEVTTIKQEDGSILHQIIASKLITRPQEKERNSTDIAPNSLQHNNIPETNKKKPMDDQEHAFNIQNDIVIEKESLVKATWFEIVKGSKRLKICKCCNKSYKSYADLKKHIDNKTAELAIYKCYKCDYIASTRTKLEQHMTYHGTLAPHKCSYCYYSSKRSYDLQRHKRLHTGNLNFICNFCQKAFNTPSDLKYHMNSHYIKYT